ncbi:MAG: hypothetical protein KUG77_01155, partial [Nannocystaceae bacterium]|nr:hypothetical protein [Nannocystaceae bacterium]
MRRSATRPPPPTPPNPNKPVRPCVPGDEADVTTLRELHRLEGAELVGVAELDPTWANKPRRSYFLQLMFVLPS